MEPDYFANGVALVTGAGSGIGRALALALARRGAQLVLWDRDADAVSQVGDACRGLEAQVEVDVVDVRDREAVDLLAAQACERLGGVRLLFCVAGVIHTGGFLESDLVDVERVVDINFWGTVHVLRAVLPEIIAAGGGHVVTVSSAFGLVAAPGYSAYNASKFAVRGLTEALRQEMATEGLPVWVTGVYPGGVQTPIMRNGSFAAGRDAARVEEWFDAKVARTSPERAAEVILDGVRRRRARVLVGADARLAELVSRVVGPAYQDIVPRLYRRGRSQRE